MFLCTVRHGARAKDDADMPIGVLSWCYLFQACLQSFDFAFAADVPRKDTDITPASNHCRVLSGMLDLSFPYRTGLYVNVCPADHAPDLSHYQSRSPLLESEVDRWMDGWMEEGVDGWMGG